MFIKVFSLCNSHPDFSSHEKLGWGEHKPSSVPLQLICILQPKSSTMLDAKCKRLFVLEFLLCWITLLVILATCNRMITVDLLGPAAVSVHAAQEVSSRKKPR